MIKNPFKQSNPGPVYSVDVVSRDIYQNTEIGDIHNKRRVVEGFHDQEDDKYCLVTKRAE